MKRHEAPSFFDPRFESIWRVILQTLHQLELFWRCLWIFELRDETWHRCGWRIFYSHSYHSLHTHWKTHCYWLFLVHCCRNAAGKCLWTWCGTGRSHRKGAGSGSFRSRSIDASRPSPGFSQDRCSFRIRSRNWARTPRTLLFAHFLHHDACCMYCFVEFSSWFYTSERILWWFLVRMLEVIDYTECSRICIVVYCRVTMIRFSLLTSMISVTILSQSHCQVSFLRLILRMAPEVWGSGVLLRGKWWIWLTWWADISSTQASWGTNVFAYAAAVSVTRVERSLQVGFSHTGLHSLWTICLDGLSVLLGILSTCFMPSSKQANITVSVLSMAWLHQVGTWEPTSPRLSIVSQRSWTSLMYPYVGWHQSVVSCGISLHVQGTTLAPLQLKTQAELKPVRQLDWLSIF